MFPSSTADRILAPVCEVTDSFGSNPKTWARYLDVQATHLVGKGAAVLDGGALHPKCPGLARATR
jgi:hypothetical protein